MPKGGNTVKYTKSRSRIIIRCVSLVLVACLSLFAGVGAHSAEAVAGDDAKQSPKKIPMSMAPGTTITYDAALNLVVSVEPAVSYVPAFKSEEFVDKNGRAVEDAYCAAIRESARDLPVIDLGWQLPAPTPGMVVTYGSDGYLSHIYPGDAAVTSASFNEGTTLAYPSRLPAGTYTYGTNQRTTITSSTVLGEGRFTVYRAGVGGSSDPAIGSSGKLLGTGDVATKKSVDNAKHGTPLTARATDTNVLKTVLKNDIGTMPNAVVDVYFWGWTARYFGYQYTDTLSFPGRYFYSF